MKTIEQSDAIKAVREAEGLSSSERKALSEKRLKELVAYAKENSPYFARLYRNIGASFDISDLPVTEKKGLQENFDDWTTDREANALTLKKHMDECSRSLAHTLYLDKYSFVCTSGTTGKPFFMLRDDYHNKIHGALISQRLMNVVGGNAFSPAENRIASIIVTNPSVSSYGSFLRAKNAAPEYSQNMEAFSVASPVEELVEKLNAYQPSVVTGYPSILVMLANEQLSSRLHINIKAVACSAEPLTPDAHELMRRAFNCPVLNNYCMTEGGEVAFSNGLCANLHLNDDWIIVEPVDANGAPAKPGQYSEGILVTDLSNYICPIIRYRMSDRVMISEGGVCECTSRFPTLKISGRVQPLLTLCGKTVSSVQLEVDLEESQGLLKYQLARVAPDALEARLHIMDGYSFEDVSARVEADLNNTLAQMNCGDVKLTVVNRLPVNDPKSGKIRPVVDEAL